MPRNGSGQYQAPSSSWSPGVNGNNATAIDWNALLSDLASALSQSVSSDGQTPMTGNLPMGNNKVTGAANGTAATDVATVGQLYPLIGQTGPIVFRNRVQNGNFQVNQRAVSGSVVLAAGAYGHDRWKAGSGGCTYTFSTSGITTTITITAGTLVQVIEGLNVEGGIYCMSWTGTSTGKIGGGSFSASGVNSTSQTAGVNLSIEFSTGTLTNVQVEPGTTATPFERRPYGYELSLCRRYLPACLFTGANQIVASGQATSATSAIIFLPFDVEARTIPSGVTATGAYFCLNSAGNASSNLASFTYSSASIKMAIVAVTLPSALVAGNATALVSNSAGVIYFTGAEL